MKDLQVAARRSIIPDGRAPPQLTSRRRTSLGSGRGGEVFRSHDPAGGTQQRESHLLDRSPSQGRPVHGQAHASHTGSQGSSPSTLGSPRQSITSRHEGPTYTAAFSHSSRLRRVSTSSATTDLGLREFVLEGILMEETHPHSSDQPAGSPLTPAQCKTPSQNPATPRSDGSKLPSPDPTTPRSEGSRLLASGALMIGGRHLQLQQMTYIATAPAAARHTNGPPLTSVQLQQQPSHSIPATATGYNKVPAPLVPPLTAMSGRLDASLGSPAVQSAAVPRTVPPRTVPPRTNIVPVEDSPKQPTLPGYLDVGLGGGGEALAAGAAASPPDNTGRQHAGNAGIRPLSRHTSGGGMAIPAAAEPPILASLPLCPLPVSAPPRHLSLRRKIGGDF